MQHFIQPTPQQLEIQASTAWNDGDVQSAETLARRTLYQLPQSTRACDVLIQVARHDARPDLEAAATEARSKALGRDLDGLLAAGDVAVTHNLLRLAEHYWEEGLQLNSVDLRLHKRLTAIAGMRLDLPSMQNRLLVWSEIEPPDANLVLLYLGLASITERDASAALNSLVEAVEADPDDAKSRLGLGRCLFAMNQHDACATILVSSVPESVATRAAALAVAGRCGEAQDILQQSPTAGESCSASRHFALGVVAGDNEEWPEAETQFALAVKCQPLSRPFRSRYCETLRRNGSVDRYEEEVIRLQQLREIIEIAAAGAEKLDGDTFTRLRQLFEAIGASDATVILNRGPG